MQFLTIPDIKGNFYGGFPYSLSLDLGFAESPSILTVNCVNESGEYQQPNLSWDNLVSIKVGNFNFQGYLVTENRDKSVSQKVLELKYKDCSCLLDQIWVGLHKRHGINPVVQNYQNILDIGYEDFQNTNSSKIIIVGRELHPCDIDGNGSVNNLDTNLIDGCDPCPSCPEKKYEYRCSAENDLKIFDVRYSFDELLQRLGVSIPKKISQKNKFLRNYVGTLRDVLKNWCDDYGYTFYWDYSATTLSNGIKLVDRTVPISINFTPGDCEVTELREGSTIENCFSHGTISYYEREGQSKSYNCSDTNYYTLACLKLRDLFNTNNYIDFNTSIRWRELAVGLSYYSSGLRDCMFWFQYYGILNAGEAKKKIYDILGLENSRAATQNQPKILRELGNMKILKVIDKQDQYFDSCVKIMGDGIAPYDQRSKNLNRDSNNPSYYFFVAEYDTSIAASQISADDNWANNYLGKYWVKSSNVASCGGVNGNSRYPSVSVQGYESEGGDWIQEGTQTTNLEFNNFGHQDKSTISDFITETTQNTETVEGDVTLNKSLILLKRDAKWYPNKSDTASYQDTINYYESLVFAKVDVSNSGQPEILTEMNIKFSQNKNIYLFIAQEVDEALTLKISPVDNFLEPNALEEVYAENKDSAPCITNTDFNNSGKVLIGTKGLKSRKCPWVNFDGFAFMMPVQATELIEGELFNPFDSDDNFDGYKVKVDISFDIPVCVPKIQTMLASIPSESNFGSLEINEMNISDYDVRIFGGGGCIPNAQILREIHETKGIQTSISNTKPEKTLQYTTIGLPSNIPSISEGLDNVSIQVSDNGVFTSYSLSDKLRRPLSIDKILSDYTSRRYPTITPYIIPNTKNIPKGL